MNGYSCSIEYVSVTKVRIPVDHSRFDTIEWMDQEICAFYCFLSKQTPPRMNQDLLNAAQEFDTSFISKFPHIEGPAQLISDFNSALNEYAQQVTEHGETINSITVLLSNSNLEAFATADYPENRTVNEEQIRTDKDVIADAHKVVYGDEEHDLAGLKEVVSNLITNLKAGK